jgi:hypothetical protein
MQIKAFKSDRFRNKRKRYNLKFQIINWIVNMTNGFAVGIGDMISNTKAQIPYP